MRRALVLLLCALPQWAFAQFLDFDGVCAAPPCPIGTLYAPSGVTFSPTTLPIVAPGTQGLTGPAGGRHLVTNSFPFQISIALARPATFFALRLSRTNASSGPVDVSVTWLKNGVPVSSTNVPLLTVNTWSTASALETGGFDTIVLDPTGGANQSFGIDGIVLGGTCYGFADVQPSDIFCNAAEWIANRGVTLGCVSGQYCPTGNVSRAQMALFMQRLGDAAAPDFVTNLDQPSSSAYDSANFSPVCATPSVAAAPYLRNAWIVVTGTLNPTGANKNIVMGVLRSNDGGTTWVLHGISPTVATATTLAYVPFAIQAVNAIFPGEETRFALGVRSSDTTLVTIGCSLVAQIGNRKTAGLGPLDVAPDRRGN